MLEKIEEGMQRVKSVKKSFVFRKRKAGPSSDGPCLGDHVVHQMKCLEETPGENQKKDKLSQQVRKGQRVWQRSN